MTEPIFSLDIDKGDGHMCPTKEGRGEENGEQRRETRERNTQRERESEREEKIGEKRKQLPM